MDQTARDAPTTTTNQAMQRVARAGAINLVGGGVSAIATFGLTVVIARGLSTSDVGAVFTTTSLFLLLTSVGQLGTSTGLVYFIARREGARDATSAEAYVRAARGPVLAVASISSLALLAVAGPAAAVLDGGEATGAMTASLRVLAVFIPFAASLNLFTTAARGLGTMRPSVVVDQVARPVLQVILTAAMVPTGRISLVVLAWVLPYLPTAVAARWWWQHRRGPVDRTRIKELARQEAPAFWRFTAPRALASVLQLAIQRLDILLIAAMAGLTEAAIYTAATRFLVLGQLGGAALSRAIQPRLARAIAAGEHNLAAALYQQSTAWLVLLTWPLYLGLSFAAGPILSIFGDDYAVGAPVIVILSATMLLATGCGMVDVVLNMAGKTSWNLYNVLLAFSVNLVANLLLIPRFGIVGAAIAWGATIVAANLVPLVQVRFSLGLHPFGRATVVACLLTSVCFGALPLASRLIPRTGVGPLAGTLVVAGLLFVAGAWRARTALDLHGLVAGYRRTR